MIGAREQPRLAAALRYLGAAMAAHVQECAQFIVASPHDQDGQAGVKRIPALTGEAIDTIGAGDAFFALASPLLAAGSDPFLAAFIGNAVGAMKVRIVGQRHQITKPEILKYLSTLLK